MLFCLNERSPKVIIHRANPVFHELRRNAPFCAAPSWIEAPMAEKKYWPNGAAIQRFMRERQFHTAEDLSRATEDAVSARTIQLMLAGTNMHKESTFEYLIEALGATLEEIVIDLAEVASSDGSPAGGGIVTTATAGMHQVELRTTPDLPPDEEARMFELIRAMYRLPSVKDLRVIKM
ncbi:MAG TPA: hypothetical protein VNX28_08495 [Gemmataceae bacterium]|nr:hypothetical protein [Gemmataceae bacterium]